MSLTSSPFGRVEPDGTVYVTTAAGERAVGQIPDAAPEEALAFFADRFNALQGRVELLEARVKAGALSPDEARKSVAAVKEDVVTANAVGDLDGLAARLDALEPAIAEQAEKRKEDRARVQEETRQAKENMVAEAEKIAEGSDWRGGANRLRGLLDQWKVLPRIDKATDDDLWHRFSSARTNYTRRRKAYFADLGEKREVSRLAKEKILAEARELVGSSDWGPTAGAFRDLMGRWKAAGPAPREADEAMWKEFREIQDNFFNRRQQVFDSQDAEYSANQAAKEKLLAEAEAGILPVTDVAAAKAAYRTFIDAYNEIGRVPREQVRALDARVKAIETAVRTAEEDEWRRTDPDARARAEETVGMLSAEIDKLTEKIAKAEARGDKSAADKAKESIATYTAWLDQAKATLADFQ